MPEIKINNTVYKYTSLSELPEAALNVLMAHEKLAEDVDGFMYLSPLEVSEPVDIIDRGRPVYVSQLLCSDKFLKFTSNHHTIYRVVYNGQEYFSEITSDELGNGVSFANNTGEPFFVSFHEGVLYSHDPNPDIKIYIQTRFPDIQPGEVQVIRDGSFGSGDKIYRLADMIRKKCPLWYISDTTGLKQIINLNWTEMCGVLYQLKIWYYDGSAIVKQTVSTITAYEKIILERALSSI